MEDHLKEALDYHSKGKPGKIEVVTTKPCLTSRDLALAYTPWVAEPCRKIEKNNDDVYKYTAKGNLVGVVSNGTAVLGLGNIGPLAGKPVMEGKGVLFKRFADIDVFDIELKSQDPKEIIRAVQLMEPTFGGINLEDIKAPECFEIEETLKETMNIPVFHDDQHGTAIISCAALLNAVEVVDKKMSEVKIVVNGAGSAAISCCNLYIKAGVKRENIAMYDSKGCLHKGRKNLNKYKIQFALDKDLGTLEDAMKNSDVFVGLSIGGVVSKEMIKSMAKRPIVFALANPDPEITYEDAIDARDDLIMATGRSDYPNQVNNVLGFPFIFRGALDVRATKINEEMKMAATKALAELAKKKVPEKVLLAYEGEEFSFGRHYIIPKPFDPRVLWHVAPAVAKAAMETGVARTEIEDWNLYKEKLKERLGLSKEIIRVMIQKAKKNPRKVVFPDGEDEKIIRAAHTINNSNIAIPILLGNEEIIKEKLDELGFDKNEFEIIFPGHSDKLEEYAIKFFDKRKRKGLTLMEAKQLLNKPNYFGSMMVDCNDANALIGGLNDHYPKTIKPALQIIGIKKGFKIVSGLYIIVAKNKVYFFADTTVNINPNTTELAEIAISAANTVKSFDIIPKVAMLSFSNFGSSSADDAKKVAETVKLVKQKCPDLIIDGEMQADTAIVPEIIKKDFPFSNLNCRANVLIFPDLNSGNIAYKLMARMGEATVIGPILMGMKKPIHVLQRNATVDDIINMTAIAVVDANN